LWSVRNFPIPPQVILITAFGQVEVAVQALQQGAADFLTKPLDMDHLLLRIERALEVLKLRREVAGHSRRTVRPTPSKPLAPLGKSPFWGQIEQQLPRIAATDDPVLITGPSGAGKEVVARRVHELSNRSGRPFVPVNCSGLPGSLLDSELFGHRQGAFTGANAARKGLFRSAEGGTLLLDEIGDMPLEMQTKLLRVLQEERIRPVGADEETSINVRILASTNRNLEKQIEEGDFREDLFYRLETFHLAIPPLKDRREDIEWLAGRFISEAAEELAKTVEGISEETLRILNNYPFPGNIRELKNILRRAVAFANQPLLNVNDLPEKIRQATPSLTGEGFRIEGELPSMEAMRRRYACFVLERCEGNKRETARLLGVSRQTLYALLREE
jgi:DNA-binding NtrC family response regulator